MKRAGDDPPPIPALDALREDFLQVARAGVPASASRRVRLVGAGLAGLVLAVAVAAVVASRPGSGSVSQDPGLDRLIAPRTSPAFVSTGPEYETLDALVRASELVVAGTVKEVRPGGEVVDIDPEYPTRFLHTVIRVEDELKGSVGAEVTVSTIEAAYAQAPGGPDMEWRERGQRVLLFLMPSPEGDRLRVPTSYGQSVYRVEGGSVAPLGAPARDGRSGPVGAVPLSRLREAVDALDD